MDGKRKDHEEIVSNDESALVVKKQRTGEIALASNPTSTITVNSIY